MHVYYPKSVRSCKAHTCCLHVLWQLIHIQQEKPRVGAVTPVSHFPDFHMFQKSVGSFVEHLHVALTDVNFSGFWWGSAGPHHIHGRGDCRAQKTVGPSSIIWRWSCQLPAWSVGCESEDHWNRAAGFGCLPQWPFGACWKRLALQISAQRSFGRTFASRNQHRTGTLHSRSELDVQGQAGQVVEGFERWTAHLKSNSGPGTLASF